MAYAQFYQKGIVSGNLIEACGDRSVIKIDARLTFHNQHAIAREECEKRGFIGYQLLQGNHLLSAEPVAGLQRID